MAQLMQESALCLLRAAWCLLGDQGHAKRFRQYLSQFSSLLCVHSTLIKGTGLSGVNEVPRGV